MGNMVTFMKNGMRAQCMEKIRQLHEKNASLKEVGKQFDMEYYEMRNSLTIWIAGFDWLAAMLKDDNGQLPKKISKQEDVMGAICHYLELSVWLLPGAYYLFVISSAAIGMCMSSSSKLG